jgi:hypothetical protein
LFAGMSLISGMRFANMISKRIPECSMQCFG